MAIAPFNFPAMVPRWLLLQALGGAKHFIVVMPDADLDRAVPIITESFYGCVGERCLAGSVLSPVGESHTDVRDRLVTAAES